jgi:hypothetical protein
MPCLARITDEALKLPFGDNKHYFYMENVCGNGCDTERCDKCISKSTTNVQGSRKFDHGLVNGVYTSITHIFDSPWYLKKVSTYGQPSSVVLEQAMEAQKKARAGKKVTPIPSSVSSSSLSSASASVSVSGTASVTSTPKKKAVPRKKAVAQITPIASSNVVEQLNHPVIQKISSDAKQIESTDEPICLTGVTRVVIRPFTHNDVTYWRDSEREKVYRRMKDGRRGEYLGRWDSRLEQIVKDAPDSDAD